MVATGLLDLLPVYVDNGFVTIPANCQPGLPNVQRSDTTKFNSSNAARLTNIETGQNCFVHYLANLFNKLKAVKLPLVPVSYIRNRSR